MPQVIPFAITAIGTAVGGSALLYGTLALASSVVIGAYQQKQAKKKAKEAYNASQVDRMANVVTSVAPRELVLGRVRKGGPVAFRGSAGEFKQRFLFHIVLAAHEIDAVEQVYFNDQPITIDPGNSQVQDAPYLKIKRQSLVGNLVLPGAAVITAGNTSVSVPDAEPGSISGVMTAPDGTQTAIPVTLLSGTAYISPQPYDVSLGYQRAQVTPLAWVWWDLGAPGSSVDGGTKLQFPDLWTDAHRGEGIAKLFVMLDYDDTAFPNGIPTVTALIRGAKVYDPRSSTTAWSENPALLARHVYQHQHFGKATISAAEDTRFIAAANACDTSQNYVINGVTEARALYRAGMVVPYGSPAAPVLDDLCQAMAGMWAFAGGELYLRAGVYTASVMTFTDADVASVQRNGSSESQDQVSISVHRERAEKFNVVNARIWDQSQDYKMVALTPLKGTALITRDGEELAQEVSMPAVYYAPQALHIAGVMMRDARDPLTVEVPLKMRAYPIELFDTVELAFTRYGWDASPKAFLVLGRTWDHEKGVIRLTLKETAAAIFTPDAEFEAQGYAENTAYETPWDIDPPGTLTLSSGTDELLIGSDGTVVSRVRVSWPEMEDPRITLGGTIEIQWTTFGSEQWKSVVVDGSASETFLTGVSDGLAILVRARTRNSMATSDWNLQQLHIVAGKTEPPDAPTGVSITQDLVFFRAPTDADLAGIRIRSLPGQVAAPVFSRGIDVIDGLVRISPARIERRLYGVQTVIVVAEDTSGNQSAPAWATLDFGMPDVDSAIWDHAYGAVSFPGTYTDCTLSGGHVVADAAASSDVYALDNLYGEPDVYATLYDAMTWQSEPLITPYSGVLALTEEIAGNAPAVEYRIAADNLADLYDDTDVYASADLYGTPAEWALWPGSLAVVRALPIEFRVSISASSEQGVISTFTLSLVMDEVSQTFANVTVDAGGTRLDPAAGSPPRNWVGALRAVYGWPAADGSGAIAGRTLDFSTELGPLVQFVDNTGAPVTALGTVKVEGYSDE